MENQSSHAATLTPSQQQAVAARGNVLVMAGAGTGKTHTLVARCLRLICEEQVALDQILVVTFTEAAAAEMRERLRAALEQFARAASTGNLIEQLALFDAAQIGTLHSACFRLIREHFHELDLDPQLLVLDEGQARLLSDEILEDQFQSHYENEDTFSLAVQELIRVYGGGRDEKIRALVLRIHQYVQTRADAQAWLANQIESVSSQEPGQWRLWFSEAVSVWKTDWLPFLQNLQSSNSKAAECLEILSRFPDGETPDSPDRARLFAEIARANVEYPARQKTLLRKPLEAFFDEAKFLGSLAPSIQEDITQKIAADPLAEDWNWVRGYMQTLLLLTEEFAKKFAARKRAEGVLDFHDLEQFAIKLLWNFETNRPTAIADAWREKLRFVCVDEYQDINAAQDLIISALSRDNRFLVGDVKQSIYRFRLADPKIFRDYAQNPAQWRGQTLALAENFRSREPLLNFINSFFELLMRSDTGGVPYDDDAKLNFGSGDTRPELSAGNDPAPRAELLLRLKNRGENSADAAGDDPLADLHEAEKEARLVALRLLELKKSGHEIWDNGTFRPAAWRDCAVLLRAPGGKAEIYAKQFETAGVPLVVERGGFYDSGEISDLLSLLQLADNPLQDVPCIAVLRSPFGGCSLDELAEIRLAGSGHFWIALNRAAAPNSPLPAGTRKKLQKFLEQFSRWRQLARHVSLSQCLEQILEETLYDSWLLSRPRGAQKQANVRRFLGLAEQFDNFQRQGLFRFLKFVEARREVDAEPDVAAVVEGNAVRLMSIHQSKGLEFPIVVLADLGKSFNEQDLRDDIILDEQYGLSPRVKPPSIGGRYPSLAWWLAQKNQRRELRGEELRLLYVAMTRARDTLILTGSTSAKRWENSVQNEVPVSSRDILSAHTCLDWLALWFRLQKVGARAENGAEGRLPWLRWRINDDSALSEPQPETSKSTGQQFALSQGEGAGVTENCSSGNAGQLGDPPRPLDESVARKIVENLAWTYPFADATHLKAKTSVTALRREAAMDDEVEIWRPGLVVSSPRNRSTEGGATVPKQTTGSPQSFDSSTARRTILSLRACRDEAGRSRADKDAGEGEPSDPIPSAPRLNATEIGLAHHKFLQYFSFGTVTDEKSLAVEARRLEAAHYLSTDQAGALDFVALWNLWNSDIGKKIRAEAAAVLRELPFTASFSPRELNDILGSRSVPPGSGAANTSSDASPPDPLADNSNLFRRRRPEEALTKYSTTCLSNEIIIVQGVADLVVLLPKEIWLLDFKTDEITARNLPEKIANYAPQLKLYARAFEKIYSRPVTQSWLHFLSAHQTVTIADR